MTHTCGLCFISGRHREFKTSQQLSEHVGMFHGFEQIFKNIKQKESS